MIFSKYPVAIEYNFAISKPNKRKAENGHLLIFHCIYHIYYYIHNHYIIAESKNNSLKIVIPEKYVALCLVKQKDAAQTAYHAEQNKIVKVLNNFIERCSEC